MPRPLEYGPAIDAKDMQDLSKILRRITTDPNKSQREKNRMTEHLNEVIKLLAASGQT